MSQSTIDLKELPLGSNLRDCLIIDGDSKYVREIDSLTDVSPSEKRFIGAQTCLVSPQTAPLTRRPRVSAGRQPDPRSPRVHLIHLRVLCVAG